MLAAGASLFRLTMHASPAAGGLACDEVVELASGLVDGDLTPAEARRGDGAQVPLPGCTRYLDQVREVRRLLGPSSARSLVTVRRRRSARRLAATRALAAVTL